MRFALPLALVGALALLSACDSFVDGVGVPVDRVTGDSLDTQAAVPFLVTGVRERFNDSYDGVAVLADLLSDAGIFDRGVTNATFPSFDDIDDGDIQFDNNSVDGVYNVINEYRFLADDLVRRAEESIPFVDDPATESVDEGAAARRLALYTGHLHGGIARYFLATYFGLEPTRGGGVISEDADNPGPFIPSDELYDLSDAKFEAALDVIDERIAAAGEDADAVAAFEYDRRLVHSLLARNALYSGDLEAAGALAADGLAPGDPAYVSRYSSTSQNNWFTQGGRARTQVAVAARFAEYAETDPRVAVETAPTVRGETRTFYRQALYLSADAPIPFMSWQETALIAAEAALADGDGAEALALVNSVRTDAGLDALDEIDEAALIEERDRELFTRGARLVDQRRFGLPFTNLGGELTGPWRYLPITQAERNANPNF